MLSLYQTPPPLVNQHKPLCELPASKPLFLWIIDLLCVVYPLITAILVSIERRPLTLFSHLLTTRQKCKGIERQVGRGMSLHYHNPWSMRRNTQGAVKSLFTTVAVMFTLQNQFLLKSGESDFWDLAVLKPGAFRCMCDLY